MRGKLSPKGRVHKKTLNWHCHFASIIQFRFDCGRYAYRHKKTVACWTYPGASKLHGKSSSSPSSNESRACRHHIPLMDFDRKSRAVKIYGEKL
jgi:hypothetical protein